MTGPLAEIRVLVLSGMGPVPFMSMLLADMGADVVRVDRPEHRPARELKETKGLTPQTDVVNRGVNSVVLDLKNPREVEKLVELAEQVDIFLEGFRPGVVERLGIGPDVLLARNPGLVYGRLTGYGQYGPKSQEAGHDINYVAQSGALYAMGTQHSAPRPPLNLLGDYASGGALGAFGIVSAVLSSRLTGNGQVVDVSMADGVATLSAKLHGLRAAGLFSDIPGTNFLDTGAPFYGTYECADGKYIAVGAIEPDFYQEFITRLGQDTEQWPPQNDASGWPELQRLIADAIMLKPRDQWLQAFAGTDACVSPVLSFEEAAVDPHNVERGIYTKVEEVLHPAPSPRFSVTETREPAPPPVKPLTHEELCTRWS